MKRITFLLIALLPSCLLFSQDTLSKNSIGLAISLEIQNNTASNRKKDLTAAATIGVEYTNFKSRFGYRAGIYYTQLNDLDILPYLEYVGDGSGAAPNQIYDNPASLKIIDFLLSGQVFFFTKNKVKLYANLGLISSVSFYNNEDYELFAPRYESHNLSLGLRTLVGGGSKIQLQEYLGLDISAGRKVLLYVFEDHYIRPFDSFSFQLKLEKFF